MKQTLKTLIRNVKSIKGNSLAEFATTTALMATLAATAAPKLSEMSEGAKAEKSRNEIDKIIKQGGQFYQDTADIEGRGRFPGQDKYNMAVGTGNETKILNDLIGDVITDTETGGLIADPNCMNCSGEYDTYDDPTQGSDWVSVFGTTNADAPVPESDLTQAAVVLHADDVIYLYFKMVENIEETKGEVFNIGGGMGNSLSLIELFHILTGVQFEIGDVATPFQYENFAENLDKCYRYHKSMD